MTLPTVMTRAGLQPQSPAAILEQLITLVTAVRPGYTANLPGSLIEDVSSTDVYAITLIDQARVELVNSLTPRGANAFLLNQLGQMLGIAQGQATNTSVFVVFSGVAGYVIPRGFVVSDGTHQYIVQTGGIIGSGGESEQIFCIATNAGSWAVPSSTVTQIVTSVSSSINLTVTNPVAGVSGRGAETETAYRARVLQANLAESQGMAVYLKTILRRVPNVSSRLVSVVQQEGGGWSVLCGGGDPYQIAYAIYRALFDISILTPSYLRVTNITQADPGVVTTAINHNYQTGQTVYLTGVEGMTEINNLMLTITVTSPTQFSVGVDTSLFTAYSSGGIALPNLRNVTVSINDYPNTYIVPFINPPQQAVAVNVFWNTESTNVVSPTAIAQLGTPAIVDYINNIAAGEPINLNVMNSVFAAAIESVLPTHLLTALEFEVSVDGVPTSPTAGTQIIPGDPESYFLTQSSSIVISQGP